jgi:dCTP deaminase
MITRDAIRVLMKAGLITVTPDPVKIGPNSIDLRLGESLRAYSPSQYHRIKVIDPLRGGAHWAIDPHKPPPLEEVPKARGGKWLLVPGQFYLGHTHEETFCKGVVPHLDGRSTCGRLSIEAHKTAGVGDNGYRGQWTLEIEATEPVLVAPLDRLFQIYFTPAWGEGMAHLIRSTVDPGELLGLDGLDINYGWALDGAPAESGPLLEVNDLYGKGGGHHYQGARKVKGPSPLD